MDRGTGGLGAMMARRRAVTDRVAAAREAWSRLDADDGTVALDLARLQHRLEQGRVALGVFGLVKRGKSTLVNALLGTVASPMGVTPETAVPVMAREGPEPGARVRLVDGTTHVVPPHEVRFWTSQEHNAGNHRGVVGVEWQLPSAFLRHGVVVLDTPGLDDVDRTFTDRTLQQLEEVDVGLVVVAAPPTIGATEMGHLRHLHDRHGDRLLVACNVNEHHADDPETVEDIVAYVRAHVAEAGEDVDVVPICATRALRARLDDDAAGWEAAGGAMLLARLEELASRIAGPRLVTAAADELDAVVARALGQLDDDPIEDDVVDTGPETALRGALAQVEDARLQAHLQLHDLFDRARERLGAHDPAALADRVAGFGLEVDACLHDIQRRIGERVEHLTRRLDLPVTPTDGPVHLGTLEVAVDVDPRNRVGGVAGSMVGLGIAGLALGPLGVVGGALVGWRLGGLATTEAAVSSARRQVLDQLGAVHDDLVERLDRHLDHEIALVQEAAQDRARAREADRHRRHDEAALVADVRQRLTEVVVPAPTVAATA